MQTVLEQGSIDKPLTFDVGLIQLSFIPVCSLNTGADLWVLKNPPSGKIHYKLSRGGFRGGGGGFGGYHQPLSSMYMLDSVCQTPL